MSNFYLGQIDIFGFNFAPRGWAQCTGTILPITQNTALFALIGTFYGGNGTSTFGAARPALAGPHRLRQQFSDRRMAGVENVTLTNAEMPQHTHLVGAKSGDGDACKVDGNIFAQAESAKGPAPIKAYGPAAVRSR